MRTITSRAAIISIGLLLLFSAVPSQAQLDVNVSPMNMPQTDSFDLAQIVFASSGAELREIKVQAWGQINNKLDSFRQLEEKYQVVAKRLSPGQEKGVRQSEKDGFTSLSHVEVREDETYQTALQSVPISQEGGGSFFSFLHTTTNITKAKEIFAPLKETLAEIGCPSPPGVSFQGVLPGLVGPEEGKELLNRIAGQVAGQWVEGMASETLQSHTYYTPRGVDYLRVNGKKVNLQLAISYDEEKKMTRLYVGTPLIYQEY